MAFEEDVVDLITDEITHIGLSANGSTEITGDGYTHQAVSYDPASSGEADIVATLEFEWTPNTEVSHAIIKRAGGPWVFRPLTGSAGDRTFNSDGRLDLTSGVVSAALS